MSEKNFDFEQTQQSCTFTLKDKKDYDLFYLGYQHDNPRYWSQTDTLKTMQKKLGENRARSFFVKYGGNSHMINQRF